MKPKIFRGQIGERFGCRSLSTWIGLGISLAALAMAFRGVSIREVAAALTGTNPVWVVVAFALAMLASVGSAMRWRELLHPHRPPPGRLFQVFMISHLGNTLLPWKLGTFLRTYLVADVEKIGLSFVIGTVAVERLLDALMLALLFLAVLPNVAFPSWLHNSGLGISVTIVPLFLALVAVVYLKPYLVTGLRRYITIDLPAPLDWLAESLKQGLRSLDILARPGQYVAIVAWSVLSWSAAALVNEFALQATGIQVPLLAPIVLLVTLQIGNKVPTVPANLGVFHYIAVLTLGLFGVDKTLALGYAFVLHTVVFLAPAVVGGLCLWKWQRDLGSDHLANLSQRVQSLPQEGVS